ncbi:hypothetical protein Tco_0797333 [Tanacetum coccineum]
MNGNLLDVIYVKSLVMFLTNVLRRLLLLLLRRRKMVDSKLCQKRRRKVNQGPLLMVSLVFNWLNKNVRYEPKAAKSVPNTGASNVGNASKSSPSHVSSMSKNQPLQASFPTSSSRRSPIIEEGGNITMSNSYAALDDESEEEIENVYDESAKLFNSTKTCESLSTFTVAAG